MMPDFYDPSPDMLQRKQRPKANNATKHYPWATVPVGKCFVIGYNDAKLTTLKPLASRMGKKLGRKFLVHDHKALQTFEVMCVSEGAKAVEVKASAYDPWKMPAASAVVANPTTHNVGTNQLTPETAIKGWSDDLSDVQKAVLRKNPKFFE